jgi:hypothetical protein
MCLSRRESGWGENLSEPLMRMINMIKDDEIQYNKNVYNFVSWLFN